MLNPHSCQNSFLQVEPHLKQNMKKSRSVLVITTAMMALEVYFGYKTGSMALLADGWHMATHAAALGITYLTYRLAASPQMVRNFNFGGGKLIALGGFVSSLILFFAALMIAYEALLRFAHPRAIHFTEALYVAILGLVVNLVCARILVDKSHKHSHEHDHDHHHDHMHDHNLRGAYLHVLADALTSLGAIVALVAGLFWGWTFLDPLIGLIGALVILKWAVGLLQDTGWELLDGHAKGVDYNRLKARIEAERAEILDLHVWKVAPRVLTCELVVRSPKPMGIEHYRKILSDEFEISHSVIEERGQ